MQAVLDAVTGGFDTTLILPAMATIFGGLALVAAAMYGGRKILTTFGGK